MRELDGNPLTQRSCAPVLLFLCALAVAAPAAAQVQQRVAATIVLPPRVVAGQQATLAVLDAQGALLPGTEVEFEGGQHVTTDTTGRATFTVPEQAGVLVAQAAGGKAKASATVILPPANPPDGVQVVDVPAVVALHEPFTITGTGFRGDADATRVWLKDKPALVLAASPASLVIQAAPRTAPGATQLVIEVGGRSPGPQGVTLVALDVSAEKQQLAPKQKAKLTVHARGTEQKLEVEFRNLTPDIVKMEDSDVLRRTTRGGAENSAEVQLEGRRDGEFSVSVRLIPLALGLPDTEAARQKLLAARKLAPVGWHSRVDSVIDRLEKNPQDVPKARNELEKMLAEKPPGEFGRLLEAAWLILLKR